MNKMFVKQGVTNSRTPCGVRGLKSKLEIDTESAKVVRKIFEMKLKCLKHTEIWRTHNENHVLTPLEYRERYSNENLEISHFLTSIKMTKLREQIKDELNIHLKSKGKK